jgi:trimeric autotransporter adhesin
MSRARAVGDMPFRSGLRARRWARVALSVTMVGVGALSCAEPTVEANPVASVTLTPPTSTVRAGTSVTLLARPLDAAGNVLTVRTLAWSSNNTAVATVSDAGVVTTLAPGDARIAVSALGKSATATVTVTPRAVASVVVAPSTASMRVGVTAALAAQTFDVDGLRLTGRIIAWSSGNTAVATVSTQGVVTGVSPGAATITATSEGRTGQAAVTVTVPPVQTVTLTPSLDTLGVGTTRAIAAVLRDVGGVVLTGRSVAWISSNAAVVSVSSAGAVTAVAPGTATITATSEGRSGTASIVVLARLASAVILSPPTATLVVGATQALTAQITDAQGNLLTNRPISYSSDALAVASVSSTGVVSALTPGSARITATSEGRTGVATVQVIAIPVATVQLTPTTSSLLVGASQAFVATARSAEGTLLTGRTTTWTSGASLIASVNASGTVTALSPGVALILVSVDGVNATATVTINVVPIATVTLTPVDPVIPVLGAVQLAAQPRDATGSALAGRTVTWSSADESIAFVSSTGSVVGFRVGTVRITATSEGVSASTLVTVR